MTTFWQRQVGAMFHHLALPVVNAAGEEARGHLTDEEQDEQGDGGSFHKVRTQTLSMPLQDGYTTAVAVGDTLTIGGTRYRVREVYRDHVGDVRRYTVVREVSG